MNLSQRIIAMLGTLGIGIVSSSSPSFAITTERLEEAQRQCDRALQENTIEALEEYLRLYPHAPTACKVLAREALGGFSPDNNDGPSLDSPSNGYGG